MWCCSTEQLGAASKADNGPAKTTTADTTTTKENLKSQATADTSTSATAAVTPTPSSTPVANAESSVEVVARWQARPARTGMYFIVHESLLAEIKYEEKVDVYQEFLRHHPNHDEKASGFCLVKLTEKQVLEQRERIRMSSYRWQDVRGVGPANTHCIPKNYSWFLQHIHANKQMGWMDFLANVAANVAVPEVIAYMGGLYSSLVVVGDWLYNPDSLIAALPRGWIFQETAFCELDGGAVRSFCAMLRGKALRARTGEGESKKTALGEYLALCDTASQLLARRHFTPLIGDNPMLSKIPMYGHSAHLGASVEDYEEFNRILRTRQSEGGFQRIHLFLVWLFGMEEGKTYDFKTNVMGMALPDPMSFDYAVVVEEFIKAMCSPPRFETAEQFIETFARAMHSAYFESALTVETDRLVAITQVARSTLTASYKSEISGDALLSKVWTSRALALGGAVSNVRVGIQLGTPAPIFQSLDLAGTLVTCSPDWSSTKESQALGTTPEYVNWSYSAEDGSACNLRCYMPNPTEATGWFFYQAVKDTALTGLVMREGKAPEDSKLRHPLLGCSVDLYFAVAKNLDTQKQGKGTAFLLVFSAGPQDEGRLVSLYKGTSMALSSSLRPPARSVAF
eukprot:gb/GEZN01004212.1/.p1 GENE.gb/GEZN01004212.1/~~gb/GEZN01004212.1/.p1  ORF type:complete len:625 (-),score=65.71 gb/GEZN01004212.1/:40-1914(-)